VFGLDDRILALSDGAALAVAIAVAALLGLRHATDPDHLVAVGALVAGDRRRGSPARLGLAWGAGHGATLVALGTPLTLLSAAMPARVEQAVELAIGAVIVLLAVRLLRGRRGAPHLHLHRHGGALHGHVHEHAEGDAHAHAAPPARTPGAAFALGVLHGIGGSGGAALLLLAAIESTAVALAALVLFAACTALSMAAVSAGVARAGGRVPRQAAPVFAWASLGFGVWYALAALALVPYPV
jgi:hypothetical protein